MIDIKNTYKNVRVFVTGHTGFKGSWLSLWLHKLGAEVMGYSLEPEESSNFILSNLQKRMTSCLGDICDYEKLQKAVGDFKPEIIFHLAAQAIVLKGYEDPKHTFSVNSQGTINILEAARNCENIKALVMVTTDKCYENKGWVWGYREEDSLGGYDPYSASKAMAELAIASYRNSIFQERRPFVASARAGNVIGGGDFSDYRIVPDCMKALIKGVPIILRKPHSVRPWLHLFDALQGYLLLGARLLKNKDCAESWNFGPTGEMGVPVKILVEKMIELWGNGSFSLTEEKGPHREMPFLRLNWDKAAHYLNWKPVYTFDESLRQTVEWYKAYAQGENMENISLDHLENYENKIRNTHPLRGGII